MFKSFLTESIDSAKRMFTGYSSDNLYQLDGMVPFKKALPYVIEHLIPAIVFNIAPVLLVFSSVGLSNTIYMRQALLATFMVCGVATIIELILGAKLPIILGSSFTFSAVLISIGREYGIDNVELINLGLSKEEMAVEGFKVMMGALIVGGGIAFFLSFFSKWLVKIIKPIVAPIVLIGIGLVLIESAMKQFIGSEYYINGVRNHLNLYILVGFSSLISSLIWQIFTKGNLRNYNVMVGIIVGYIVSVCIPNFVDFSPLKIDSVDDVISTPRFLMLHELKYEPVPIILITLFFVISFVEIVGNVNAMTQGIFDRPAKNNEISGCYIANTFGGFFSALLGSIPLVTFTGNITMVSQTKVMNRYHLFLFSIIMIFLSFFPPIGSFFSTIPDPVMGGVLVVLFGSIFLVGIQMFSEIGFTPKNILIGTISTALGFGITLCDPFYQYLKSVNLSFLADLLGNAVLNMFLISLLLSYTIPDKYGMKEKNDSE